MDRALYINSRLAIPLAEIELRTSRSSGPGGQHANVTASRVEAVFDVSASTSLSDRQRARLIERVGAKVTAVSQDSRSQARNRAIALERLSHAIAEALKEAKRRRPSKPTKGAQERRLKSKKQRAELKEARRKPKEDR